MAKNLAINARARRKAVAKAKAEEREQKKALAEFGKGLNEWPSNVPTPSHERVTTMATKKTAKKKVAAAKPEGEAKVNKSAEIRTALENNPGMKPKEISELLASKGIEVKPNVVSITKSKMNKAKGTSGSASHGKRGRKAKGTVKTTGLEVGNGHHIAAAFEFLEKVGGLGAASAAMDRLTAVITGIKD